MNHDVHGGGVSAQTHKIALLRSALGKERAGVHKQIYKGHDILVFQSPCPAASAMPSSLASPTLAEPDCSRLDHVDPRPHCPMSDQLSIETNEKRDLANPCDY